MIISQSGPFLIHVCHAKNNTQKVCADQNKIYLCIRGRIFQHFLNQKSSWIKALAHFAVQNSQSCRAQWNSPSLDLRCSPGGSLDSRALCPHDNDTCWGISACHACLKHLWCFPCQRQEQKYVWISAAFPMSTRIISSVCVCVEVLYLSTLNLGKWIEFLMNTVKLMASTNAGSLLKTLNNQSNFILSPSTTQFHHSLTGTCIILSDVWPSKY